MELKNKEITSLQLKAIQPPPHILTALVPPNDLTVSTFLGLITPRQPGSRKITLQASEWFMKTDIHLVVPHSVEELVLPYAKMYTLLDSMLRHAVIDGAMYCSVRNSTRLLKTFLTDFSPFLVGY